MADSENIICSRGFSCCKTEDFNLCLNIGVGIFGVVLFYHRGNRGLHRGREGEAFITFSVYSVKIFVISVVNHSINHRGNRGLHRGHGR
jgi:hypothetical protein